MASLDPIGPEWDHDSTWQGKVRRLARPITWIALQCYRRRKLVLGLLAVALLGAGSWAGYRRWLSGSPEETAPPPTLEAVLEELDAGRYPSAREMALRMQREGDLSFEEESGPFFVLGAVVAHDAAEQWSRGQRQGLYLLAARYLQESRDRGFPSGREADGLFLLGQCLYLAGKHDEAIPVLEAALKQSTGRAAERRPLVLRLLASAHYHSRTPDLAAARRYNEAFLSQAGIDAAQRAEATLDLARIALQQGDLARCATALEPFQKEESPPPEAALVALRLERARCRRAATAEAATSETLHTAAGCYRRLIKRLRALASTQPPGGNVARGAAYLIGVCFWELGDLYQRIDKTPEARFAYETALEQFRRTRRLFFDQPEGLAAAVAEPRLLQQLDRLDEAFERYIQALQDAGDLKAYDNPWLPADQLIDELVEAQRRFMTREEFEYAVRMGEQLAELLPAARTTQLVAESYRAWAEHLERSAATLPAAAADEARMEARDKWRRAGRAYRKLADLHFTTRRYTDDLWQSADCLMKGHQFRQAIPLIQFYLTQEDRSRRPRGLLGLGEAYLNIGQPESALKWLREITEFFARHPLSYRARLVAAKAHMLLGDTDEAIRVLNKNLFHDALSPDSLEWRDSLFALGELYYRRGVALEAESRRQGLAVRQRTEIRKALESLHAAYGEFNLAIEKLVEAVERYPQAPQIVTARYQLAESYRKGARYLIQRLEKETVESDRAVTQSELEKRLAAAVKQYDSLASFLNQRQEAGRLTDIEVLILRNTYFGQADSLFDLEEYEAAIQAYSTVSNRYQGEPVSLEAFVQIAHCYHRLGRLSDARSTLEQAKIVLQRMIRSDADFLATTRYRRDEWQALLDWLSKL